MCDKENNFNLNFVKQTLTHKKNSNLTVNTLNAFEVFSETITTQKILLDGIALNSLMLQKILMNKNSVGASTPQITQSIEEINQNILFLNNSLFLLSSKVNDNAEFIEFLKTQITIIN